MADESVRVVIEALDKTQAAVKQAKQRLKSLGEEGQKHLHGMQRAADDFSVSMLAIGAGSVFGRIVSGVNEAIRTFNQFQGAALGASAVADRLGISAARTNALVTELAADGLLNVAEAATAVKNLFATGFNLDETRNLILAFKDAAAFGRQSALTFGQAVASATEGIKNGNSILVDNAGITKNLSVILLEQGFAQNDVNRITSDAAVRQALYNGLLREAALFTGNAAKLSATLAGDMARGNVEAERAKAAYGEAMAPAVQQVVKAKIALLGQLRELSEENPKAVRQITELATVLSVAAAAAAGLPALFALGTRAIGILGATAAPIALISGGLVAVVGLLATFRAEQAAQVQQLRENSQRLDDLLRRYDDLQAKSRLTTDEQAELRDVMQQIVDIAPQAADGLGKMGEKLGIVAERAREAADNMRSVVVRLAQEELAKLDWDELLARRDAAQAKLEELLKKPVGSIVLLPSGEPVRIADAIRDLQEQINQYNRDLARIPELAIQIRPELELERSQLHQQANELRRRVDELRAEYKPGGLRSIKIGAEMVAKEDELRAIEDRLREIDRLLDAIRSKPAVHSVQEALDEHLAMKNRQPTRPAGPTDDALERLRILAGIARARTSVARSAAGNLPEEQQKAAIAPVIRTEIAALQNLRDGYLKAAEAAGKSTNEGLKYIEMAEQTRAAIAGLHAELNKAKGLQADITLPVAQVLGTLQVEGFRNAVTALAAAVATQPTVRSEWVGSLTVELTGASLVGLPAAERGRILREWTEQLGAEVGRQIRATGVDANLSIVLKGP